MYRTIRLLLLLAILSLFLVVGRSRTFACLCVPESSPAEALGRSSAVFAGRATSVRPASESLWGDVESVIVTFHVSEVWKGGVGGRVEVLTAKHGIDCGYEFAAGGEYLVYAVRDGGRLAVWFCSRTRPLSAAGDDLAVLGDGSSPDDDDEPQTNLASVEVHTSIYLAGKRETSQSFVYFLPWEWVYGENGPVRERVEYAFWNDPSKAPIFETFLWHGSVYGGHIEKGLKFALVEKIGNNGRMTGPWEFGGVVPMRITVDDQPLVAEMVESRTAIYVTGGEEYGAVAAPAPGDPEVQAAQVLRYEVKAGDTLSAIALEFGTTIGAIAQANNITNVDLIFVNQVLVIP